MYKDGGQLTPPLERKDAFLMDPRGLRIKLPGARLAIKAFDTVKNQYFGDVNDYIKYGLLRCFSDSGWRVGVCWMLTSDDGRSDGNKLTYLKNASEWRGYDPSLFDVLNSTVGTGLPRDVSVVENRSLIAGASFFSDFVPNSPSRDAWFENALVKLSPSDLLFFDPDNGLQISAPRDSRKYLKWIEVRRAWESGASLLIFQHFIRENRLAFINRLTSRFGLEAPGATVISLVSDNVLFLLVCQPRDRSRLETALELVRTRWRGKVNILLPSLNL